MSAHARRISQHAPRYTAVRGRRGEFAKIEQRRREYLGEALVQPPPGVAAPSARAGWPLARAGAVAALASTFAIVALPLLLAIGGRGEEPLIAQGSSTPSRLAIVAAASKRQESLIHAPASRARRATGAHVAARTVAVARAPAVVQARTSVHARAPLPEQVPAPQIPPLRASNGGFSLEAGPWQLTADGTWQTEVVAFFADGSGAKQPHLHAQVSFSADQGEVVQLDPWLRQTPAAMVTTQSARVVEVTADAIDPAAGSATLTLPAPPTDALSFSVSARAIGPRLASVGWTPLAPASGVRGYRVYRRPAGGGALTLVALLSSGGHSWRDAHVEPDSAYEYDVVADLSGTQLQARAAPVDTPGDMPATSIDAIAGKGMFLFFSPDTSDPNSYAQFDPDAVVGQAVRAGVSDIELRLSRGTFAEAANPAVRAWLDRFIDGANEAGIKLVAWSVPRRDSADDVAQSVATARYRTPAGNGFAGLALDLETGDDYMGHGAQARERIAAYMEMARAAVGPDYLLIATVISPRLTHFTNDEYPYSRIARYASVMQPMEYWHHFRRSHGYAQADVADNCAQAVSLTRSLAGREVPVNVAGQSTDLGRTGSPSPAELHWCLGAAQAAGAIGEMFFDYQGTTPGEWAAIGSYSW